MSLFTSASRAISSVFDTVGDVAKSTQNTISIATGVIDRKAIEIKAVGKEQSKKNIADGLLTIKRELDADADLKALFDASEALFA